ncbi:MAG: response regulator transcription factor [Bacilli bacterium]
MAEAIAQVLRKNNYTVDLAHDGEYGLDCALTGIYDILILDWMLPRMSGIAVLKALRNANVTVPILLLTAKGETEDKVTGLDSGADDYLAKPFKSDELLARLRALGRRKGQIVADNMLSYGDLQLNPNTLRMTCGTNLFQLTLKESQMLTLLMNAKGNVVPKNRIIEKLWGLEGDAEDNNVEVYVSFLRKKMKALETNVQIKTVRGVGYSLHIMEKCV